MLRRRVEANVSRRPRGRGDGGRCGGGDVDGVWGRCGCWCRAAAPGRRWASSSTLSDGSPCWLAGTPRPPASALLAQPAGQVGQGALQSLAGVRPLRHLEGDLGTAVEHDLTCTGPISAGFRSSWAVLHAIHGQRVTPASSFPKARTGLAGAGPVSAERDGRARVHGGNCKTGHRRWTISAGRARRRWAVSLTRRHSQHCSRRALGAVAKAAWVVGRRWRGVPGPPRRVFELTARLAQRPSHFCGQWRRAAWGLDGGAAASSLSGLALAAQIRGGLAWQRRAVARSGWGQGLLHSGGQWRSRRALSLASAVLSFRASIRGFGCRQRDLWGTGWRQSRGRRRLRALGAGRLGRHPLADRAGPSVGISSAAAGRCRSVHFIRRYGPRPGARLRAEGAGPKARRLVLTVTVLGWPLACGIGRGAGGLASFGLVASLLAALSPLAASGAFAQELAEGGGAGEALWWKKRRLDAGGTNDI